MIKELDAIDDNRAVMITANWELVQEKCELESVWPCDDSNPRRGLQPDCASVARPDDGVWQILQESWTAKIEQLWKEVMEWLFSPRM
eukprot:763951-Hanusia_phi.AAC.3